MAFLMIEIMELLCTRFPLLISLTELAVGFGRKRDALDWDTAHGETLHIHPKDSKKNQIQPHASRSIQNPSKIRIHGSIGSPVPHKFGD